MSKAIFWTLAFSFLQLSALAISPINKSIWTGLALKGYDPVAYFTLKTPTKGKKKFSYDWKGATWRFSNNEHLQLFIKTPEQYAPQYGAYCAYAVSQNKSASIDPHRWTIHNEKLYLNYNKTIHDKWLQNKEQYIDEADKNWPSLKAK